MRQAGNRCKGRDGESSSDETRNAFYTGAWGVAGKGGCGDNLVSGKTRAGKGTFFKLGKPFGRHLFSVTKSEKH